MRLTMATLAFSSCATVTPTSPAPRQREDYASAVERGNLVAIFQAASPSLVLLLNYRPDGKLGYGAGFAVNDEGDVLTSLHVVANAQQLRALTYSPSRTTYSTVDGGLSRFAFEHGDEAVTVELVRVDAVLDLALVHLDVGPGVLMPLPIREAPMRVGEPVYTLGHPGESVWSFTAGVASALHQGLIQHDATIDYGNSGGPLLDAAGRVVGVNVLKLQARRPGVTAAAVGFARPIALARPLWTMQGTQVAADRATAKEAVHSCLRAVELGSKALLDCYDWDSAADRVVATLTAVSAPIATTLDPAAVRGFLREQAAAELELDNAASSPSDTRRGAPRPELAALAALAKECEEPEATLADLLARHRLKLAGLDAGARREVLRMGIRFDASVAIDEKRVWVRLTGRNVDGSEHQHAQLWERHDDGWRYRDAWRPEDLRTLPAGWPPPMADFNWFVGTQLQLRIADSGAAGRLPAPAGCYSRWLEASRQTQR